MRPHLRLAVLGDLLFTHPPGQTDNCRGLEALTDELRQLLRSCDLVVANLECTLPGSPQVATEPRVFADPRQIDSLTNAGIQVVSLANNHAFDGGDEGFNRLTAQLGALGISHCGAGANRLQASAPLLLECKGLRLAILAAVADSSGMYRFASNASSGVAHLEPHRICRQIAALRQLNYQVLVLPHWGEERCRWPSPQQVEQAQAFIQAGACLVAGHHPHVIQGLCRQASGLIVYSLGNALANPVYWDSGDCLRWNRFERTGGLLLAELCSEGVTSFQQLALLDDGRHLGIDHSWRGRHALQRANRFLRGATSPSRYQLELFRVRTLLPLLGQLRWHRLRRLRPEHLRKALHLISRGLS